MVSEVQSVPPEELAGATIIGFTSKFGGSVTKMEKGKESLNVVSHREELIGRAKDNANY